MAKLEKFKKGFSGKPEPSNAESGGGNDDLSDWKSVRLKFTPEPGKVSDHEFINMLKTFNVIFVQHVNTSMDRKNCTIFLQKKLLNIPIKNCKIFQSLFQPA